MRSTPVSSDRGARPGAGRLLALASGVVLVFLLTWVPQAGAHALLVSSDPHDGQVLGVTPGDVGLRFDEALDRLSHAVVVDPAGRRFSDARVSGKTMVVPLSTNVPGRYVVDWTSVSLDDGHTVRGSFRFAVATATGASSRSHESWTGNALISVARWIEYAALLVACGFLVLGWLQRGRDRLRIPAVGIAAVLLVSGLAVVVGEALKAGGGNVGLALSYLGGGAAGWVRVARLFLEASILALALGRRRLSIVLVACVVGVISAAGHAADVRPVALGILVDAVHLAAAGIWAGGIMALGIVRISGRWESEGSPLDAGFSRLALWSFACSVGLGVVEAYQQLGSVTALITSTYGVTLMAKAAVVVAMVPLSLLAWRKRRLMLRSEALLALVVVAAAAALAALPVPARPAAEATETGPGSARATSPFPIPGDLTMGGKAGNTLVGMSLHPGRPGRNRVTIYLAPPEGTTEAKTQDVSLSVDGRSFSMSECGPSCRMTSIQVQGPSRLVADVGGRDGGEASFKVPALPAPSGEAALEAAVRRMNRLTSYRVDENLSGIRSTYRLEKPHKMLLSIRYGNGTQDSLWVGHRTWTRAGDTRWKLKSRDAPKTPVPYFVWNPFTPLEDVYVMGEETVGGRRATLITFFGGHGSDPEPVWFEVWIGRDHTVLQSMMFAPGHFMFDSYSDLDRSAGIAVPSGG